MNNYPTVIVLAVLSVALLLVARSGIATFCSLGRKTTVAYVVGLMLVVLIGLTSSRSVLWLSATAQRVNHAEQVSGVITDVLSEAAKAQAHTRGYVITGGERYLQAEQTAAASCRERLAALRQLITDPAQQARGVRLEAQANELIQWFSRVIAARRTGNAGAVREDMIDHGEDLMDSLRALVAQMDNAELRLLQQYQQSSSNVSRFTHLVITSGTIIGLIIFLSVLFGLNRSKTKGQQALATLTETKALLQAAMDHSQAGIAIVDAPSGKLRYVNQAGLLIGGVTQAELVTGVADNRYDASWNLWNLDGTPLAKKEVPLARAILFGEQCTREFIIRRAALDDRIVLANAAPIHNPAGEVTAGIVIFLDITEHKRTEKLLQQNTKELHARNEELTRFNRLMAGRELCVIELKQQVNELAAQLGQPRPYPLAFLDAAAAEVVRTATKPGEQNSQNHETPKGTSL